jgi:hypothetical protein
MLLVIAIFPMTAWGEPDPNRVGAEECGQCHKKEFKAWNRSTHSVVLSDRDDDEVIEKSEEYAEALGIDDIEAAPECSSCHFTYFFDEDDDEQVTGVDCESCHGVGKQWMDIHSDYGSVGGAPIENPEDEDPLHREQRWAQSEAAGMLRPGNIAAVTSNCLDCHTGPGDRIVNEGGHTAGSDFDLPRWLAGEVRHNFHRTNQGQNAEITAERRRQLYVLGRALQLQYALVGLSSSTEGTPYNSAMQGRAREAITALEAIESAAPTAEIASIVTIGKSTPLVSSDATATESAAEKIADQAAQFGANHDGSALSAIDPLIPSGARGQAFSGN